jgi:predicted dehydrogenase
MLATHSQSIQRLGWFSRRDLFGNLLHSPGVHSLDLMNYLLGEPASVFAQSAPPIQHQVEYPDTMTVTVTYANGCVGSLFASVSDALDPPAGTDTLRLLCENGALSIDFRPPGLLSYVVGGRERIVRGRSADRRQAGADHAVRAELENFAACIRRCATPFIDPLEASAAVALCEAAEISSCNKLPVAVACMSSDGIEWWSPAELPEVSQSHG